MYCELNHSVCQWIFLEQETPRDLLYRPRFQRLIQNKHGFREMRTLLLPAPLCGVFAMGEVPLVTQGNIAL